MPLYDHFHPPLSERRHWEAFYTSWVSTIAEYLNTQGLPEHFFAEPTVHVGGHVQIDVATFADETDRNANGASSVATVSQTASVATPAWVVPAVYPDSFAVHIINRDGGPTLAAAIELVSPSNKDRQQSRRAFAVKSANYLYQGIPHIVVDVVTNRRANLHNATMGLLDADNFLMPEDTHLYATAYRPVRRDVREEIDVWHETLAVSAVLPSLPLYIDVDFAVLVDFEATYQETCGRLRIDGI